LGFIVGESDPGDAMGEEPGERYFNMLVCLLERVRDALARMAGEHVIDVNLATRWAKHPELPEARSPGAKRKLFLNRSHITEASKQVYESLPQQDEPQRVRFSVGKIWRYDAQVDPGVVMADTMANYLYTCTAGIARDSRLEELEYIHGCSRGYFGIPLVAGAPSLTNVSATGLAQEAINDARLSRSVSRFEIGVLKRRWAAEQANQWIEFFEGGEKSA
jgi:hypothetical protein